MVRPRKTQAPRLHLFFTASHELWLGQSDPARAAPWPLGIPRLKFPAAAPSRSVLKLEEALLLFLRDERAERLRPGMRAVDLGAAPGGWSWLLARRGLRVMAVDNGPLAAQVLATEMVEHRRADGFRYTPQGPVDWMMCDMIEQPRRIAALAAQWLERGWCRGSVFNLKLPMKQRYAEVEQCLALLEQTLRGANLVYELACKQLYHDRDEVTVYVWRETPLPSHSPKPKQRSKRV